VSRKTYRVPLTALGFDEQVDSFPSDGLIEWAANRLSERDLLRSRRGFPGEDEADDIDDEAEVPVLCWENEKKKACIDVSK
jgi:hypothetical protein